MDNGNTTINFTSTTLGSIATYQCRDNVQTVHCTEDGIWLPQLNITCSTIGIQYTTCYTYTMYMFTRFSIIILIIIIIEFVCVYTFTTLLYNYSDLCGTDKHHYNSTSV